jgi:hypothetical protein
MSNRYTYSHTVTRAAGWISVQINKRTKKLTNARPKQGLQACAYQPIKLLTALTFIFAGALYADPASADPFGRFRKDLSQILRQIELAERDPCRIKEAAAARELNDLIENTRITIQSINGLFEHSSQLDRELEGSNEMMAMDPNAILWLLNNHFQNFRTFIERVSVYIHRIERYNGMARHRTDVSLLTDQLEELRSVLQGIQVLGLSLSTDEFLSANRNFFEIVQSIKERLLSERNSFEFEPYRLGSDCSCVPL